MSDKMYLCDEYKLYFKIEDDVEVLHNEVELYNAQFVGNNAFCHEEYIDGQRALTYSIPAMTTMNQFLEKKIHKDELVDRSGCTLFEDILCGNAVYHTL